VLYYPTLFRRSEIILPNKNENLPFSDNKTTRTISGVFIYYYLCAVTLPPKSGQGRLVVEVSRSHTQLYI
jgi:hypothetical protein